MNGSVSLSGKLAALLLVAGIGMVLGAAPNVLAKRPPEPAPIKVPAVFTKEAPEGVQDLKTFENHVKTVLKRVMPAVVGIRIGMASGSGVVISEDGYVLTAGHVSGKAGQECTLLFPDGKKAKGKTLGANRNVDSGLIQITDEGKWPHVGMGDSAKLKLGQWMVAVGHPGGYKPGRTPVVRVGRVVEIEKAAISTDNTLVGGDSGGPLFDMEGKVVGIHSRIGRRIDQNLHVPVHSYRADWDRLVKAEVWPERGFFGGRRAQAYLGVVVESDMGELKVTDVTRDSPAYNAGFKVGDVILNIDGKKFEDRDALASLMRTKQPGNEVTVELQRDKETIKIKVKLGRRPAE